MKKSSKKPENRGELSQMIKNCKDSNERYNSLLKNKKILNLNSFEKNA